jgi:hypothetical protein
MAGPRLGIEIATDYNSAGFAEASANAKTFGVTVESVAAKNIERTEAQKVRLQALAAEYGRVAASAEAGSAEQVAALDLAAKAQKRLGLEVLASNAMVRSSARETALATTETAKFSRGALEATGSFGKFGAALALGSGGFIVGAGVAMGIKTAVKGAQDYNVALRSLDGAIVHSGDNLTAYTGVIAKLADGGAKLGYTNTDILGGLKQLTLITGNATDAVTYMGLVEDLARGKGISLQTAATAVGKAIDGKTTALQRYGIVVQKGESVETALTQAQQRWAGQAKDSTTATMQLGATVHDLEEKVGQGLLPEVNHIAKAIEDWISKSKNQKTVTDDVKTAVGDLTGILKTGRTAFDDIDKATGGFEKTLELLVALKFAPIVLGWTTEMIAFAGASALGAASSESSLLLGTLGKLKALGPLALVIALDIIPTSSAGQSVLNKAGIGFLGHVPLLGGLATQSGALGNAIRGALGEGSLLAPAAEKNTSAAQTSYLPGSFGASYIPGSDPLKNMAAQAASKYGVPSSLFLAQIKQESGFNPAAHNASGASGIAQFMPGTMGSGTTFNPYNPAQALPKAAQMMAGLYAKYKSWPLALAAYNWGSGNVDNYLKNGGTMPSETQNYISSIMGASGAITAGGGMAPVSFGASSSAAAKPKKPPLYKIPDALEAKIRAAQQTFGDSATQAHLDTLDSLLKTEEADLKAHGQMAKAQSVANEITKADDSFTKTVAANLKAQIKAVTDAAAAAITTDKQAITSAFSNIISDVQTAFSAATQDYITNTLGPKFSQGGLLTPKEQQYADMQAADTAKSLTDGLASAQQTLADDMNGALIEHIVDISTGATRDIFGPKGTPAAIAADKAAVDQAQRMIDENELSIDATAERKTADQNYANAVTQYQQQRTDAEHAMTNQLNALGQGIAAGTAYIGDLPGILAQYGLTTGEVLLSSGGQFQDDMGNLGTATQALAQVMLDEAAALAALGDGKDAAKVSATAQSIAWQTPIAPGQSSVTAGLGGAAGYFLLNPIPKMASGGDILRDGLAYLHAGERVQPADVAAGRGGGGAINIVVNAPNYVGSHDELAAALKHPSVLESVSAAVIMGSRRGHIKQSDIRP